MRTRKPSSKEGEAMTPKRKPRGAARTQPTPDQVKAPHTIPLPAEYRAAVRLMRSRFGEAAGRRLTELIEKGEPWQTPQ